eukprot:scaffold8.g1460.t1
MIKFVLMVNKQGQTRLAKYTDSSMSTEERRALEAEIVRKCLTRVDKQARRCAPCGPPARAPAAPTCPLPPSRPIPQCNVVEHRNFRVVYRRYASLFFLVGVDAEENELGVLEFIHCMVETLDKWFSNVCELDIMFSLETAHFILDEMLVNGCVVETNRANALAPVSLLERAA